MSRPTSQILEDSYLNDLIGNATFLEYTKELKNMVQSTMITPNDSEQKLCEVAYSSSTLRQPTAEFHCDSAQSKDMIHTPKVRVTTKTVLIHSEKSLSI